MSESIDRVAIKDEHGTIWSNAPPDRYADVIFRMAKAGNYPMIFEKHKGFMTNTGRFVNRKEAKVIAKEAGQLLESASASENLFSEDLW